MLEIGGIPVLIKAKAGDLKVSLEEGLGLEKCRIIDVGDNILTSTLAVYCK
jgi:hypothetical protein